MDTTIADPARFFLSSEEYLTPYPVLLPPPPPASQSANAEGTSVVYNQQDGSFGFISCEDYSTAAATPSASTSTSTGYDGSSNNVDTNSHDSDSGRLGDPIDHSHNQRGLILHQPFSESASAASPSTPISCCLSPAPLAIAVASPITSSHYYHPSSEFMQYSKESYEQQDTVNRLQSALWTCSNSTKTRRQEPMLGTENEAHDVDTVDEVQTSVPPASISSSELRRQIHIQSEQKRRAQIKDGFEDLRNELPSCLNKKMSKVALLHRTIQHIQHLKSTQMTVLSELERLMDENEQLRKFQQGVLQKQALEKMYQVNGL